MQNYKKIQLNNKQINNTNLLNEISSISCQYTLNSHHGQQPITLEYLYRFPENLNQITLKHKLTKKIIKKENRYIKKQIKKRIKIKRRIRRFINKKY